MQLEQLWLVLPALERRKEVLLQKDLFNLGMDTYAVEVRDAHVPQRKG